MWGSGDGGASILNSFAEKLCIARALRNCGLWARLLWVPGVFSRMGKLKRWNCQNWQNNFKVENTPSLYCLRLAINGAMFKSRL